jgi:hypothetical protein
MAVPHYNLLTFPACRVDDAEGRILPRHRRDDHVPHLAPYRFLAKRQRLERPPSLPRGVHEEHGTRLAIGALPVEGAPVLTDPFAVPRLPATDVDGRVLAADRACEVKAKPAWLKSELRTAAMTAGRAGRASASGPGWR